MFVPLFDSTAESKEWWVSCRFPKLSKDRLQFVFENWRNPLGEGGGKGHSRRFFLGRGWNHAAKTKTHHQNRGPCFHSRAKKMASPRAAWDGDSFVCWVQKRCTHAGHVTIGSTTYYPCDLYSSHAIYTDEYVHDAGDHSRVLRDSCLRGLCEQYGTDDACSGVWIRTNHVSGYIHTRTDLSPSCYYIETQSKSWE